MRTARYDGLANWYDGFVHGAGSRWTQAVQDLLSELLGSGPGRCLDLGCGGGTFIPLLAGSGWTVVGGCLVHVGTHPCFVSPVASVSEDGSVRLFAGYHEQQLVFESPAYGGGLRDRVGAWQVPLAALLNAVAGAGLRIERVLESPNDPPRLLGLRAVRD